ncbi:MAG: energy-coupling factor transporter transmembrane component T family protein [Traorella sp.]
MDERLFVNLVPGNTFLDKLTGKTKVRTFIICILILIATWDFRIIGSFFVMSMIALISLKPNWKKVSAVMGFVSVMNLFNLFLLWIIKPNYGLEVCGGSTVLFQLTSFYVITAETMWYFVVRFFKMFTSFILSLTFIQSITPSELAAGLYSIKVPYKICTVFSLAFRYIPDITKDFHNIKISMQARGMELDSEKVGLFKRLKQNILILVPLIVTSFDRVGNISNAMDLRGFGKKKTRTYYCEHDETKDDKLMKVVYCLLLIAFVALVITRIIFPAKYEVWTPWIH